jgi:two-component system, OmpR family, alkaline phosphatase synthesis response regulator PhoP
LKKKILVIEDEADIARSIKDRLEGEGYDALFATGGYEGLYKYLKEKPDLIILDIMLPELNGYEVCREIRREIDDKKTPIIMLTAKAGDSDRIKGRVLGATKFIPKPFNGKELLAVIKTLLP